MKWIIRLLPYAAVAYGGGISGAWLGTQFASPLPPMVWGWFGAALTVFTILAGIERAMRRDWTGWALVIVAGIASCVMDAQYFAANNHGWLTAWALGLMPTLIGVLAGMAHARQGVAEEKQQETINAQERAFELEQRAKDAAMARRLKMLEAQKTLDATPPALPEPQPRAAPQPERVTSARQRAFDALDETEGDISNAALAQLCGVTEATARGYRSQWRDERAVKDSQPAPVAIASSNGNGHTPHGD